jgi:hypothetical protein
VGSVVQNTVVGRAEAACAPDLPPLATGLCADAAAKGAALAESPSTTDHPIRVAARARTGIAIAATAQTRAAIREQAIPVPICFVNVLRFPCEKLTGASWFEAVQLERVPAHDWIVRVKLLPAKITTDPASQASMGGRPADLCREAFRVDCERSWRRESLPE